MAERGDDVAAKATVVEAFGATELRHVIARYSEKKSASVSI
ncbi:protein of unknown function (plasmid) [Shinella sp. WSC3-e]|nr:protein of unknown function [Shinella sp. WSC3-e]